MASSFLYNQTQMYYCQVKRRSGLYHCDYYAVGRLKGYNAALDLDKQDDNVCDFWERNRHLYDCIVKYYKIIALLSRKREEAQTARAGRRISWMWLGISRRIKS